MVQIDCAKDALLVNGKEGFTSYENVAFDNQTEDVYRYQKVQMITQKPRLYIGAVRRSLEYSKMGILNCIIPCDKE